MRNLVLACAVAIGATTACTAQAHALSGHDPCELFYLSASYGQDQRQQGVTDVQMTERINKEWMPIAVKLGLDEFWWKVLAAGPVFAYKQDADATPHEVGDKARKACWKLYT